MNYESQILSKILSGYHPATDNYLSYETSEILSLPIIRESLQDKLEILRNTSTTNNVRISKSINCNKPYEIFKKLKVKYPEHIIFIQVGYFWELYNDDALLCSEYFGWTTFKRGREQLVTGVPINAKYIYDVLKSNNEAYVLVRQTGKKTSDGRALREVSEII